jgi:hypothetical protein
MTERKFKMTMLPGLGRTVEHFTEETAPWWLKEGGRAGSTMCNRWFWNDYIMKLEVGGTIDTDFRRIERIA